MMSETTEARDNAHIDFISEDDKTFEEWLKFQAIESAALDAEARASWRQTFENDMKRCEATPKIGLMKFKVVPGEFRYAVAVRDGEDLWLALWMRISPKGDVYVMMPRADGAWNPHASLHASGDFHNKSYDRKVFPSKRQAPRSIVGCESMGSFMGFGPKTIGAACDPAAFTQVFEAPPNVLGPKHGSVLVDLLAPGADALTWPGEEVARQLLTDTTPHVLMRVFR